MVKIMVKILVKITIQFTVKIIVKIMFKIKVEITASITVKDTEIIRAIFHHPSCIIDRPGVAGAVLKTASSLTD